MEIVLDSKYPEMFRLKWPDGVLSADFYNITRARENTRKIVMEDQIYNMEERP